MYNSIKNKLLKSFVIVLIISLVLLAGCGQKPSSDAAEALSGTITLAGSTSVQPVAEELSNAFMQKHKGVRVEVAGGGSGAGIKAAQTNTADIGMASREIKAEETGIKAIAIALDGIAVVVNPSNAAITDLTQEQVKDIYTGKIANWKDVGGKDAAIVVINREEGSGTHGAFKEIVLGKDKFIDKAIVQSSTGAVREAVRQDPNAIGYISLGGLNNTVKAVKINGVECSEENIKAKKYSISRPFNYLVNESKPLSKVAQIYLDFILSDEGQKVVTESGYISIK